MGSASSSVLAAGCEQMRDYSQTRQSETDAALRPPEHSRSSGAYSPSSLHFFLCFSGFLRLSGTTLVAAGAAAALRASRRASLPLSSRFFFFRILFIPPPSLHPTAIGTRLTSAGCAPRTRIKQVLLLAVLDPRICISVAFPPFVRTSAAVGT